MLVICNFTNSENVEQLFADTDLFSLRERIKIADSDSNKIVNIYDLSYELLNDL